MTVIQHAHPVPPVVSLDDILEIIAANPMSSIWDIIALAYPRMEKAHRSCLNVRVSDQVRVLRKRGLVEVVGKERYGTLLFAVPHEVKRQMSEMVPTEGE